MVMSPNVSSVMMSIAGLVPMVRINVSYALPSGVQIVRESARSVRCPIVISAAVVLTTAKVVWLGIISHLKIKNA